MGGDIGSKMGDYGDRIAMMSEREQLPAGAIENGREHFRRLAEHYDFECEGGPLHNCTDFISARQCFEHLAEYAQARARIAEQHLALAKQREDALHQEKRELVRLLKRYRDETPLGHQPHMIADEVDAILAKREGE